MSKPTKLFYEFGPFRIDIAERILLRAGEHIQLTPKAFDTLLALVEQHGHIVEKDVLMKLVWPDTFVEEVNLAKNISDLRKILSESSDGQKYIETIPKRGYRFATGVRESWDENEEAELILRERLKTRIVTEEETGTSLGVAASVEPGSAVDWQTLPASSERRARGIRRKWAALLITIGLVATGLFYFFWQRAPRIPNLQMTVRGLTNTGNITTAVISPDGKYVAYAVLDSGEQSLWLKQVAVGGHTQIVPPAKARYMGLTFSRDGNYLYYVKDWTLYQAPALGGVTRKLNAGVAGPATFSPDGQQLAFVRLDPSQGEAALIRANADGSGEQKLATHKGNSRIQSASAAWSPDGEVVAFSTTNMDASGSHDSVVTVRVRDGVERTITSQRWRYIRSLGWLSDASGLVMIARDRASAAGSPLQIWHLSYPSGEPRRITNDLQEYRSVSLTADSRSLIAVKSEMLVNLWMMPSGEPLLAKQIVSKLSEREAHSMSWAPDGKVIYTSAASGNEDIWLCEPDGSNPRQLTADPQSDHNPSVSPDGRYIVFSSYRSGAVNLWRMDFDGTNLKQLTSSGNDDLPVCSPDGKWVVYMSGKASKPTLWRVAIEGGAPVQVTGKSSKFPAISPDGKLIACLYQDDPPDSPATIAVIPFEGGEPVKTFNLPFLPMRWTTDGRALTYIDTREGVSNLWNQPLAGGPPKQLTSFQSETINSFAWSHDGKRLALVRGVANNDVVMISNFR